MPSTQAFTVDWTVEIEPEGDVSNDVTEITITKSSSESNSATIQLDTSQRPHALEEQQPIDVTVTDGNDTVTFTGTVDDVNDASHEPTVTVDAREPEARFSDVSLLGYTYSGTNLWNVVDSMIEFGPSQVRGITFNAFGHSQRHGAILGGSTDFGLVRLLASQTAVLAEEFSQHETKSGDERGALIQFDITQYENPTDTTFTLTVNGLDSNGDAVQAQLDLPPGDDAEEIYGRTNVFLRTTGGTGNVTEVTGIESDIGPTEDHGGEYGDVFAIRGHLNTRINTDFKYSVEQDATVADGIDDVVNYISSIDAKEWTWYVNDARELKIEPVQPEDPSLYQFTEGQNVIRPMATRNIDDVVNYVKVSTGGGLNVWVWAYDGDLYRHWGRQNPHLANTFPDFPDTDDKTEIYGSSPAGGLNDIDQIDLRAHVVQNNRLLQLDEAIYVAKQTLAERYRPSVSGTAPVAGVHEAAPGDLAEVYYPSRGIPQKVVDNTYTVEKVELNVTPQEARTEIDFGMARPTATEAIGNTAVNELRARANSGEGGSIGGVGFEPTVGTIEEIYDDGTARISGEDGTEYDNVEIV